MTDPKEVTDDTSWIDGLNKKNLIEECKKRKLRTTGHAKTLKIRLEEYMEKLRKNVVTLLNKTPVSGDNSPDYGLNFATVSSIHQGPKRTNTVHPVPEMSVLNEFTRRRSYSPDYGLNFATTTSPAHQNSTRYLNTDTNTLHTTPAISTVKNNPPVSGVCNCNNIATENQQTANLNTQSTYISQHPHLIPSSIPNYQHIAVPNIPDNNERKKPEIKNLLDAEIIDKVRKWNVKFDQGQDPLGFIERMEELAECYQIPLNKLIKCLPEVLTKTALAWYRNTKSNWSTWDDFVNDYKTFFLPPRFEIKLADDIRARVQKHGEKAKDFITVIQSMQRWQNKITREEKLERIYENLLPEYRLYIKPRDYKNLSDLLRAAEEYEHVKANWKTYRSNENDKRRSS